MPKHVTYPGPHIKVSVPGIDEVVRQGVEVEVESELADNLIDQGWISAQQRAARERAGDPPAATDDSDEPDTGPTPAATT